MRLFIALLVVLFAAPSVQARKHAVAQTAASAPSPVQARYVLMGEDGLASARVITSATACPAIVIDGASQPMLLRAPAETLPLRLTRSDPEDSKPSAFPVLTCEMALPKAVTSASVEGVALPLPKAVVTRMIVIGDTGCRLKKSKGDGAWQGCNDPNQYAFGKLAATAAAWHPDLIVHVGDYHYRENACAADQPQCQGSPWGYGWDAWNADFFAPAAPLLAAAPLAAVRGNHENCERAGQGWWRMFDPRPLVAGRDCVDPAKDNVGDYSDPFAIPLGQDAQLIMLDMTKEASGPITDANQPMFGNFQDVYRKYEALAARMPYNIAVNHIPILGFSAKAGKKDGDPVILRPGSEPIQSAFSSLNPWIIPDHVQVLLSGHVHVWEQISFKSQHPSQFIAGFSGTQEDIVPLPETIDENQTPAPAAEVAAFSSWVNGFGWMSMERTSPQNWNVTIWDVNGNAMNHCTVIGKASKCDVARVTSK